MRYGAHAIELAGPRAASLDSSFGQRLAAAPSNDPAVGDGRRMFLERARPAVPQLARAAASYAALRRLSPGVATGRVGCYDASAGGDRVRLVHRRTGRTTAFDVSVQAAEGPRLSVAVTPAGQSAVTRFSLDALTEPERAAIIRSLVAKIASHNLAPQESAALCEGRASLGDVVERGLLARVEALAHDRSDSALAAARDVLDLVALEGRGVPFDVQTAFDRVRGSLPAAEAQRLSLLAERLGFSVGG
jgi:hypothetical protein